MTRRRRPRCAGILTLFQSQVRLQYSEMRASGEVVHVEVEPGRVVAVAAWMLYPVACSGMVVGSPQVAPMALFELSKLLKVLGLRRSSRGGISAARGDTNEAEDTCERTA